MHVVHRNADPFQDFGHGDLLFGTDADDLAWRPLAAWLKEWVFDLASHADYREKWGAAHWDALRPGDAMSGQVNYGRYA